MTTVDDKTNIITQDILAELCRAEHLHPVWPAQGQRGDHVWAAAIVAEEAGEALQAALNYQAHGKGSIGHIRKELVQTGAMVLRALINLEAVERRRNERIDGPIEEVSGGRVRVVPAGQDLADEHNIEPGRHWGFSEAGYPMRSEGLTLAEYTEGSGL